MQGQFTKQEAKATEEAVKELFNAIPNRRRFSYLGHLNDILLFIGAAEKEALNEEQVETN